MKERRRQDRLHRWIRSPRAREGVEDEPDTERLRTPLLGRPCGRLLLSTRNEHGPRADAHRPLEDYEQGAEVRKILRDCERCDSARRHVSSAQVSLAPPLQPLAKTMRPRIALATGIWHFQAQYICRREYICNENLKAPIRIFGIPYGIGRGEGRTLFVGRCLDIPLRLMNVRRGATRGRRASESGECVHTAFVSAQDRRTQGDKTCAHGSAAVC